LEREIRQAMPAADIRSVSELARLARVQRDTLYGWFRGDGDPKPATLEKVAAVLHLRLGDLWDYEAPEGGPPPVLTPEVLAEIRAVVEAGVVKGVAQALAELGLSAGRTPPRRPQR
jgi:transcriptional regulator with XRE-family HTH domain